MTLSCLASLPDPGLSLAFEFLQPRRQPQFHRIDVEPAGAQRFYRLRRPRRGRGATRRLPTLGNGAAGAFWPDGRWKAFGSGKRKARIAARVAIGLSGLCTLLASPPAPYALTLPTGFSLIANQLNRGGNTVAEVLPAVPEGSVLYKLDASRQSYTVNQFLQGHWLVPDQTLAPGEGAWFRNPTSTVTIEFSGAEPPSPSFPAMYQGYNLVSLPARDFVLPPPHDGDTLYQWDSAGGYYVVSSYHAGQWDKAIAFAAGEAFGYRTASGLSPKSVPTYGTVYAASYVAGIIDARLTFIDWITPLAGPEWCAQLYGGPSESALKPAGGPIPFRSGALAGYFFGNPVEIPGVQPGDLALVQIRLWAGCRFGTYEEAVSAGLGFWSQSGILSVRTGGPEPSLPGFLEGLTSFNSLTRPAFFGVWGDIWFPEIGPTRTVSAGSTVDWGITPNGSLFGFGVDMREDYRWQRRDAQEQWQEAPQFTGSTFHAVTFADAGIYRAVGKLKNLCDFEVWSPTLTLVVLGPPRWANPVFDLGAAVFRADLTGPATGVYEIQVSTDLMNWAPWLMPTNLSAGFQVTDTNVALAPWKFYRASLRP